VVLLLPRLSHFIIATGHVISIQHCLYCCVLPVVGHKPAVHARNPSSLLLLLLLLLRVGVLAGRLL
jgi:hypothetical protein